MDVLLATIAGVGVRSVLYSLHELFGNATPILIGAWEGLAIHQLSRMRKHSTSDHYLAYAFRSLADIILFGNIRRIVFIALWTGVSVISAEAIYPAPRARSRSSRHKSTRSTRTRTHEAMERPQRVPIRSSSPPRLNRNDLPTVRPSQPPTPPSIFLEGESDVAPNSPSPYIPPPDHEEEEEEEEESPLPKHILLPTPSLHAPTEPLDQDLERHLYTIEEASTELSRDEFAALGAPAPYAPSIATTMPIPVPNPTTYFHRNASQLNLADPQGENLDDSYADSGPPIVVPNATSEYTHDAQPERPFSPAESDGLTTPGKAPYPLGGANDPLQTPPAMSPAFSDRQQLPNDPLLTPPQLSPVFSDRQQLAEFGSPSHTQVVIPPPSSKPPPSMIQVLNSATASVTTTVAGPDSGNEKAAKNGPVEYLSSSAKKAPSKPPPDSENVSEAGSDETDSDETVISVLSNGNSNQIYARAEALREEAKKMENQRVKLVQELDEAKNSGDTRKILFLKEEIRMAEVESRKLHERAVRRFIKARNSERKPQTVDVHGLKVNEAISTTERALRQAYTMGYPSINVIVGKGLHSAGGKPVLKQAIQRHMETQLNIPCQVHPTNAGVLVCQIPQ